MPVGMKTTETTWWTWNCPSCGKEQRCDASCNAKPRDDEPCFTCESNARKARVSAAHKFLDGAEVVGIGVGEHSADDLDRIRLRTKDGRLFDVSCTTEECPSLDIEEAKP